MPASRLLLLAGLLLTAATTHAQTTAPTLPTLSQRYRPAPNPTAEKKPLYVVDGVALATPYLPGTLAPEDIASITILKKAADTAPYGPEAVDGVVVVTTKQKDTKK